MHDRLGQEIVETLRSAAASSIANSASASARLTG
jgi:hypothetical protein